MRATWFSLALLLGIPAYAADRTELIRPVYVSPVELESMLLNSHTSRPLADAGRARDLDELEVMPRRLPGNGPAEGRGLIPEGITAMTVDTVRGTLALSGSADAIEQIKRIVRLLDTPPRELRLSVRVLSLDAAALRDLPVQENELGAADKELPWTRSALVDERQALAIAGVGKPIIEMQMGCRNNRPLHLFWDRYRAGGAAAIIPRINGDGTITLLIPFPGGGAGPKGAANPDGWVAMRRIGSGQTVLVRAASGPSLLVKVEIAPEPAAAGAK